MFFYHQIILRNGTIPEKYSWVGEEFWDIIIAESMNTTPWDVRNNITSNDITRLIHWNNAKGRAQKIIDAEEQLKLKAASMIKR